MHTCAFRSSCTQPLTTWTSTHCSRPSFHPLPPRPVCPRVPPSSVFTAQFRCHLPNPTRPKRDRLILAWCPLRTCVTVAQTPTSPAWTAFCGPCSVPGTARPKPAAAPSLEGAHGASSVCWSVRRRCKELTGQGGLRPGYDSCSPGAELRTWYLVCAQEPVVELSLDCSLILESAGHFNIIHNPASQYHGLICQITWLLFGVLP